MIKTLPDDVPVLTINSRLARWLLFQHHKKNVQADHKVWNTPEKLNLASWLKEQWTQSWPDRYVLSDLQSFKIWEEIIRTDPECMESGKNSGIRKPWTLLHFRSAAEQAAKAYSLIREYRLNINLGALQTTQETRLFINWARRYEKRLDQLGAIDPSSLIDHVRQAMGKGKITVPKKIVLAGFEEINPQLQIWIDFLKSKGTEVNLDPDPQSPILSWEKLIQGKNIRIAPFSDRKNEAIHCARWIRSVQQPGKNIGIVVPELELYHRTLKNEFKAELAPASVYPWEDTELPFNISLGTSLSEEAMVQVVLQLFAAPRYPIPLENFLYVLKSPFLKAETAATCDLELSLIRANTVIVHLQQLENQLNLEKVSGLKFLVQTWRQVIEDKSKLLPSQWAKQISDILKKLGWPSGNRKLTSGEVQCLKKWNECLDEFASLDHLTGNLSRQGAADELYALTQKTEFHVKTREQPIQVIGLLESAEMSFDHLWVVGCTSECLPAPPAPNPFLPILLQKKLSLPHADPHRELEFANQSLRRLLKSSPDIVFSYPVWENDSQIKKSPLLDQLQLEEVELAFPSSHRLKDLFPDHNELEVFHEPDYLPPTANERDQFTKDGLRAGYGVLKDQADCPFRAFAAHRLKAESREIPETDFDARHRGNLIHKSLEIFWGQVRSRKNLIKLQEENGLDTALENCVLKAMRELSERLTGQTHFARIEKERTIDLLREWMREESRRPDFEVDHKEKKEIIEVGGLKLFLRIDRIDITQNGSKLLIDYKTGNVRPLTWFGTRIQEPQLPLYAIKLNPDGIAFACLSKGEFKWKSLTDPSKNLIGLGPPPQKISPESGWPDWHKVLDTWTGNLTRLAHEFLEGRLAVDPFNPNTTCRNCSYHTLCRIGELALGQSDGEEDI